MPPRPEPPNPASPKRAPKVRGPKVRACPICGRPTDDATKPFCSPRCRDVDLHRWLSGHYVVPGSEDDEEDRD